MCLFFFPTHPPSPQKVIKNRMTPVMQSHVPSGYRRPNLRFDTHRCHAEGNMKNPFWVAYTPYTGIRLMFHLRKFSLCR